MIVYKIFSIEDVFFYICIRTIFNICLYGIDMNDAVTIIVGAGAVLDFDHKGIVPLVKNITNEVLDLKIQNYYGEETLLIRHVHDNIVARLKEVGNPEVRRFQKPYLNFEELLHVLEMCYTYSSCWRDEYCHWQAVPLFGALVNPNISLSNITTMDYVRAAITLENKVMEIVNNYDSLFKNDKQSELWYRIFWNALGRADIFTLNYDSTIENSISAYEDGFDERYNDKGYSRFNAKKYYENPCGKSTISHLHGSILYSEAKTFPFEYSIRDLVKNVNYETANKNRLGAQSEPSSQAKEKYVQPYIISGSKKTEKLVNAPYNVYLSNLSRKVIENKRLMIIGYSFGDLYLNEILGLGMAVHGDDFKVVIIDKYPQDVNRYVSLMRHIVDNCSGGTYSFISRMVKDRLYVQPGQKEFPLNVRDYKSPIISSSGNLMMCISGFKDAVERHLGTIKNHLGI